MTPLMLGAGLPAGLAAGYAALVGWHRFRYGKVPHVAGAPRGLLDGFIPSPEVLEHHQIAIQAPPGDVLAVAKHMRLMESPLVRALIRARELALGGAPDPRVHPGPLVEQMKSIGWGVLADEDDREIVLGAVTVPWVTSPVFRSIPPAEFAAFDEPGYVKIAWSLRVEATGPGCTFHTETRVATTDADTRAHFRKYWSFVAPGVELIRLAMLRPLKREAEEASSAAC